MGQVTVTINNRDYQVACDEGQEEHLERLGSYIDKRAKELTAAVGDVGDSRLLVMVNLLIADELSDQYAEIDSLKKNAGVAARAETDENLSQAFEALAERIESIAERLEQD
ncbi:MAG: cell division protein ZapA [Rhodospirillaceae bacterium]|jgi:cell division protein ZapA|nr:cell division protein ZapA [Rhodospirillaceae bacterium]MBT4220165.1 cell division protein ZapA [Rhodospirillaceae bacterium]MBT4463264.1 cell division protein ZapA [Rhodospirillaceae bacterium]MBT5307812.1 cell division protein ZapA [Rhodospirillaceae bacterium]MBT6407564.1 cell division protein ZapA [Rhodospirillaceae bacterium]